MLRTSWFSALGLVIGIGFLACKDDSSTSSEPTVDGGTVDTGSPSTSDGSTTPPSDGSATDSSTPGKRPSGIYIRFAHFVTEAKDQKIDFCIMPMNACGFTDPPIIAALGQTGGLNYSEVSRFVPITPGKYIYSATTNGDCSDGIYGGDIEVFNVPSPWQLITFSLTEKSTGAISYQLTDEESRRDPTKDRVSFTDMRDPEDSNITVTWISSSTSVPLTLASGGGTALLPPGQLGKISVGPGGNPYEIPYNTVAGGHAAVFLYEGNQLKVCDHDDIIPTTGALSTCTGH